MKTIFVAALTFFAFSSAAFAQACPNGICPSELNAPETPSSSEAKLSKKTGLSRQEIETRIHGRLAYAEWPNFRTMFLKKGIFLVSETQICRFKLGYTYTFNFSADTLGWVPEYKSEQAMSYDSLECDRD